jgi:beta-lactamase class D
VLVSRPTSIDRRPVPAVLAAHRLVGALDILTAFAVYGQLALLLTAFAAPSAGGAEPESGSCFLLQQVGSGDVERSPSDLCGLRVTPASTYKIPHALAAIDAGVVRDENEVIAYDGADVPFDSWKSDHTLASAIRYSVVWYFQRIAERLGMERERDYLRRFDFGNADPSSGLTSFWLGGSLLVSPEEELRFLSRLYRHDLPVSERAMSVVERILIQPPNALASALGEAPFAAPWPAGTILGAKTGRARDASGRDVRWLVGHVERGGREWIFVSAVVGGKDLPPSAAIDLASTSLRRAGVL